MEPRDMLDALMKPFPPHAIKQRQGGGNQLLSYVETETVIRRLNATVGTWDFRITEIKVIDQLVVIWGEMTIPGLGTRAGTGVQVLRGGEDMWKGAASDCLKKCATLFGVGIELYGPDLEAGEMPDNTFDFASTRGRRMPTENAPDAPGRARGTSQNIVPQNGSPVIQNPTASDAQLNYIRGLAKQAGMVIIGPDGDDHLNEQELAEWVGSEYHRDWPALSKGDASEIIEGLKEEAKRQAAIGARS